MDLDLQQPQPNQILHSYGTRIRQNISIKPSARLRQSPDPPQRLIRKIKPSPPSLQPSNPCHPPIFPLPNVTLHNDDATSKVFAAIAKSFLSVDNRAMTIKDLADMTVTYGYNCQNVSAASQAITTYIRTHLQRCDDQQDQPLLLRHTLSGTPSDDDLLPALYSRSGGAHCSEKQKSKDSQERSTHFRKGTTVWYLSRVTGAPCPFARAGIRLCDYVDAGRDSLTEQTRATKQERRKYRRRERESMRIAAKSGEPSEQCGQKRKRLSSMRSSSLSSETDSGSDESDMEQPPPTKVKLTLRLNPAQVTAAIAAAAGTSQRASSCFDDSDSDDSMSVDDFSESDDDDEHSGQGQKSSPPLESPHQLCLPPYPRRSISIPIYRPSVDFSYHHRSRSPSVPHSVASLPPDSEDEFDDFHVSMTTARYPRRAVEMADDLEELSSDGELDGASCGTSPGPRSPSAPIIYPRFTASTFFYSDQSKVKQEPTDVQGLLDAWEDLDNEKNTVHGVGRHEVKREDTSSDFEGWNWDMAQNGRYLSPVTSASSPSSSSSPPSNSTADIKLEEDVEFTPFLDPSSRTYMLDMSFQQYRSPDIFDELSSAVPSSPLMSPSSPVSEADMFSRFRYPESPSLSYSQRRESELTVTRPLHRDDQATIRPRAKTVPSITSLGGSFLDVTNQPSRPEGSTFTAPPPCTAPSGLSLPQTLSSLLQSLSVTIDSDTPLASTQPECVSPRQIDMRLLGVSGGINPTFGEDAVVVKTCQPCDPDIWATQVEGISVYQTKLGSQTLLRRIDTDFVNLTTILAHSGSPTPVVSTIPNAVVLNKGTDIIQGLWVPLSAAHVYIRDHPASAVKGIDLFLSDKLAERFPSALQDFVASSRKEGRLAGQFGKGFGSMVQARELAAAAVPSRSSPNWEPPPQLTLPSRAFTGFQLNHVTLDDAQQVPLSPSEQEMFQALCVNLEWEKENSTPKTTGSFSQPKSPCTPRRNSSQDTYSMDYDDEPLTPIEDSPPRPEPVEVVSSGNTRSGKPLRRSMRVAHAATAKTRTTKRKKESIPVL